MKSIDREIPPEVLRDILERAGMKEEKPEPCFFVFVRASGLVCRACWHEQLPRASDCIQKHGAESFSGHVVCVKPSNEHVWAKRIEPDSRRFWAREFEDARFQMMMFGNSRATGSVVPRFAEALRLPDFDARYSYLVARQASLERLFLGAARRAESEGPQLVALPYERKVDPVMSLSKVEVPSITTYMITRADAERMLKERGFLTDVVERASLQAMTYPPEPAPLGPWDIKGEGVVEQ